MAEQSQLPPRTSKDSSGLEGIVERITQALLSALSSRGATPRPAPDGAQKLLETFYKPGKSDSGLLAQIRQKILIVKVDEADAAALKNGDPIGVHYGSIGESSLTALVKRVSEYPNAASEFKAPTKTVLIEWKTGPDFIQNVKSLDKGTHTVGVTDQADQADNFIINPGTPDSEPDPPVRSLASGLGSHSFPIAKSDFSQAAYALIDGPHTSHPPETLRVVVSDTGLKFNLGTPNQEYTTWNGLTARFPIAPNPNRNATPADPNPIGFCSLTNYLDDTYPLPPRDVSFPAGIPTDDGKVWRNPHDDHPGRHGTRIAAIVAQNPAGASAIIPLKIFDFLGFGTLFDILCGFNYVFSRIEAGENIRIVNASWSAALPKKDLEFAAYRLLEKKIAELRDKKVFVLAAAGNRETIQQAKGKNLSTEPAIPACYSAKYDNVITVTSVTEKWKKCLFNRKRRSHYINQALHDKLLQTSNPLEWLLNLISNIIPDGYTAVEGYSPEYVGVGVVAHRMGGVFPAPFQGIEQLPIVGSSFATAYMSAYVVSYLKANPQATRAQILASLPMHPSLDGQVAQGHYLELSTVTGASIEANFESVLRAILSTFP